MKTPPIRKSLGQHFLHQRNVIDAIAEHFAPRPDDVVVEIGPGRGALTEVIAPRVSVLHAVEVDRQLAGQLAGRLDGIPNLVVHRADALDFDYSLFGSRIRVIGNLPYNISTPLLFRLLAHAHCIQDMHLMLQKEVVDRILAGPGSKTYGRLSVMVQQQCHSELVMQVAPGAFTPPPKVQSSVVSLIPQSTSVLSVSDRDAFSKVVRLAFAQRRKTLRNALKTLMSEQELLSCDVSPGARAEQLSVQQFVELSNHVASR